MSVRGPDVNRAQARPKAGRVLHAPIGYMADPTQRQLLVHAATVVGMVVPMRIAVARSRAPSPAPVAAG